MYDLTLIPNCSALQNTELTFNYHWDDLLGNEKKTCYCGSKNCAGQIGGKIKEIESKVIEKI